MPMPKFPMCGGYRSVFDLGVRLTAQLYVTLFGGGIQESQDPNERIRQAVQQYQRRRVRAALQHRLCRILV